LVLAAAASAGCLVGGGDGWVEGELWVENCKEGVPLGESAAKQGRYDLHADFFAAQPQEDTNESKTQRRNTLTVRIQPTSNNMEVSDGLMLQLVDLSRIAQHFAAGEPVGITNSSLCRGTTCATSGEDELRGHLYLYTTCPDLRQPLVGGTHVLSSTGTSGASCLKHVVTSGSPPVPAWSAPCPKLTAAARAGLDKLCEGDFNDRTPKDQIATWLGDGACLYLCALGEARRGQPARELDGFLVNYGDRVAGILSMRIIDGRAVTLNSCASVSGRVTGMFDFEVVRGRAAQSFP
jgi:hypothetical protein